VTPENLLPNKEICLRARSKYAFDIYYELNEYTDLNQHFVFNMISTAAKDDHLNQLSPFVVRVNPNQTTRYFMMYSLNIGGVKRWLAVDQKPETSKKIETLKTDRTKSIQKKNEPIKVLNPIAALVEVLMNPVVVSSEEREYKRFYQSI
jgi:hypothetical protein